MFKAMQAVPLFPTMVWTHDLKPEDYEPMNKRLLAEIDAMLSPRPPLQMGQTWQTDQRLHDLETFAPLVAFIETATNGVLDYLEVDHEGFEITGCWANVNPPGAPHSPHTHPNNYLSGVYYVQTAAGADSISFYDPRPMTNVISPNFKKPNGHNLTRLEVRVPPGRLVIFPAWFQHGVGANMSNQERVSISFDIMLNAFTEKYSKPKWEGLPVGGQQKRS